MEAFLEGELTEKALFEATLPGMVFETAYLCSALVLPEHRRRGLARGMVCDALRAMLRDHPIRCLFCWPFTDGGQRLAESISAEMGLPLRSRGRHR
jgi:predicted acetyltransferase